MHFRLICFLAFLCVIPHYCYRENVNQGNMAKISYEGINNMVKAKNNYIEDQELLKQKQKQKQAEEIEKIIKEVVKRPLITRISSQDIDPVELEVELDARTYNKLPLNLQKADDDYEVCEDDMDKEFMYMKREAEPISWSEIKSGQRIRETKTNKETLEEEDEVCVDEGGPKNVRHLSEVDFRSDQSNLKALLGKKTNNQASEKKVGRQENANNKKTNKQEDENNKKINKQEDDKNKKVNKQEDDKNKKVNKLEDDKNKKANKQEDDKNKKVNKQEDDKNKKVNKLEDDKNKKANKQEDDKNKKPNKLEDNKMPLNAKPKDAKSKQVNGKPTNVMSPTVGPIIKNSNLGADMKEAKRVMNNTVVPDAPTVVMKNKHVNINKPLPPNITITVMNDKVGQKATKKTANNGQPANPTTGSAKKEFKKNYHFYPKVDMADYM
uniref:Uncharacterized protein n=1 Tax=Clastoptera arizonana TaxID=38151 RepID=A0A1B6CQZ6_9HEMI